MDESRNLFKKGQLLGHELAKCFVEIIENYEFKEETIFFDENEESDRERSVMSANQEVTEMIWKCTQRMNYQ